MSWIVPSTTNLLTPIRGTIVSNVSQLLLISRSARRVTTSRSISQLIYNRKGTIKQQNQFKGIFFNNQKISCFNSKNNLCNRYYSSNPPSSQNTTSNTTTSSSEPPTTNETKKLTKIAKATEQLTKAKNAIRDAKSKLKSTVPSHENIYTLPNFLTVTRLISAPIIGYLVVHQQLGWALSLFAYSCVTDFVDGFIARHYKLQTVVGSVIDPMADKFLMMTLASCLAASGDIPMYMAVLILGRDFLLGLSAFYYRYISLPPPKTFTRYWDFSIPSAEVHPTTISKYNTFFQMIYLGLSLAHPVLNDSIAAGGMEWLAQYSNYINWGMQGLEYTVATTTILSGLSYVFSKNAVKILK